MRQFWPLNGTIYIRKIAYGPDGFTCKCGGTEFVKGAKKGKDFTRNFHRCVKCNESYMFVKRRSLGGTIL